MEFITLTLVGIIAGLIIISKIINYFENNAQKNKIEKFKNNNIKISVSLKDIKIKSNSWTEEREIYTSRRDAGIVLYNKLTNNDTKNVEFVEVNLNEITYNFEYDRKKYIYKSIIDFDREKLKIWFVFKKQTALYLNPKTEEMYLDLEFLYE